MKYLGNKQRLYDFLSSSMALKNRKGQKALDLFCGTGSVSFLFKTNKINTVSNDFLSFCSHRTRAILLDEKPQKNNSLNLEKNDGIICNNYSENAAVNIFKYKIAQHIDGARTFLKSSRFLYSESEYSYYLAQIIEAADFRSNIMGSYESFYKKGWRKQSLKDWAIDDFELVNNHNLTSHFVYNEEALSFLKQTKEKFNFIYLDPPYNSRQYSSVFHVLETISDYENFEAKGINNKNVLIASKKTNFCSKTKCLSSMKELIENCANLTEEVFLSYSSDGILSLKDISNVLFCFFANVKIYEHEYRKFKTNSRKINDNKVKEYLFYASK